MKEKERKEKETKEEEMKGNERTGMGKNMRKYEVARNDMEWHGMT